MVYSEADLGPFQKRLAELRQIVQDDAANHPPAMIELLERKLGQCGAYLRRFPVITCPSPTTVTESHVSPTPYLSPHTLNFMLTSAFSIIHSRNVMTSTSQTLLINQSNDPFPAISHLTRGFPFMKMKFYTR